MEGTSQQLANLLGALAIGVADRVRRSALEQTMLDETSNTAVVVIGHASGMSIDQLGCILGRSHAATVRVVDRMTRSGLAQRSEGDGDRRKVALTLTKAGNRYRAALLKRRQNTLTSMLGGLSDDECRVVERLVRRLLGTLACDASSALKICRYCDESQCPECPMVTFGSLA